LGNAGGMFFFTHQRLQAEAVVYGISNIEQGMLINS
jgi:hypothetical protein